MGEIVIPAWFRDQMKRLMGLKFAPATLDTHHEALCDISREQIIEAVTVAQQECDEFPSPRKLRSLISRPDIRGHYPPCRNNTECLAKVLAS